MKGKKVLGIIGGVVVVLVLISSGWIYNIVNQNNQILRGNEMVNLQTTFVQQYGSQATIKQLVSPDKVYAALWSDGDGVSHVSWNIGGLWVMVYSSNGSTAKPQATP